MSKLFYFFSPPKSLSYFLMEIRFIIEQKSRRSFPLRKAYGFLIEIYEFSLLKEFCFLHKKVEVRL